MALFSDEGWLKLEDLGRYEGGVSEVLRLEGIDGAEKIELAREHAERRLDPFLRMQFGNRTEARLHGHVVVRAGLKHWVSQVALRLIFEDAYSQQLNDRYKHKRERYAALERVAEKECFAAGIEWVEYPVGKAAAPVLTEVVAAGSPGGVVYVAVSNEERGEEGAPSEIQAMSVGAGKGVQVRGAGASWHVYAGSGPLNLKRQTSVALPAGAVWTWIGAPLVEGVALGSGQAGARVFVERHQIRRG